jgi:hypothetical protein
LPAECMYNKQVSIPPWFDFACHCIPLIVEHAPTFQSHLGSILPDIAYAVLSAVATGFNPTLVRFCHAEWRIRAP